MITSVNNINFTKYTNFIPVQTKTKTALPVKTSSRNLDELTKMAQMNKMQVSFSGGRKPEKVYTKHTPDNYSGCMIGAAIGDAIGRPVECDSIDKIRDIYGLKGVTDIQTVNGIAPISEDTQLSIFTADGLIKSAIKSGNDDIMPDLRDVYASYQDWLKTQQEQFTPSKNGWVSNIQALHSKRGQRLICAGALASGMPGSMEFPINGIKGSDGVMRTAPAGLKYYKDPEIAFEAGARCVSLTNGSPDAYLPAGLYSAIVANIIQGKDMPTAVDDSLRILKKYRYHEGTYKLVDKAADLSDSHMISRAAINKIGAGWNADEAIAIGVYCAMKTPDDFKTAVLAAVNHSGDSDTTGGIAGGIVGAFVGEEKIPDDWKYKVELCFELDEISKDLFNNAREIENVKEKYPVTIKKKKRIGLD